METATKPLTRMQEDVIASIKLSSRKAKQPNGSIDAMPPQLMTRLQFIKHFKITSRCEWNWRKEGKVPIIKIGKKVYYSIADVIEFQEKHVVRQSNI